LVVRGERAGTSPPGVSANLNGRDFSHALLAAVTPKSEAELNFALDRIIAAGLLFRQGNPPFATYLFKHALVQEVAYGTLLREPRRALHARIAGAPRAGTASVAGLGYFLDAQGKIVREAKVASEPESLVAFFASLGFAVKRFGLEARPLSQWPSGRFIAGPW
jgi:hypothetical protein